MKAPRSSHRRRQDKRLLFDHLESRLLLSITHLYTFNDGTMSDWVGSSDGTAMNGAFISGGQLNLSNAGVTSGQSTVVQYGKLPDGVLPSEGSATIEVWYSTSSLTTWMPVFSFGDQVGSTSNKYPNTCLLFTPNFTTDNGSLGILSPGGSDWNMVTGVSTNDGIQHMATVVVDAGGDKLSLYIDGVLSQSTTLYGANISSVNDLCHYLGRSLWDSDEGFTGSINEFRVYDEALSSTTISQDAAAGPTMAPSMSAPKQMENLNRGVVALTIGDGSSIYVGWRLLGTDPSDIAFNVYCSSNGGPAVKLNTDPITKTTDFMYYPADPEGQYHSDSAYSVRPVVGGVEQSPSESFTIPAYYAARPYVELGLMVPDRGIIEETGESYKYSANDCSVGDVDGDGAYELIVKWDPSNAKDNSQSGYTGNVYIDAYEMDGTFLWRIDLGKNIRAGAHYTQFIVYDLDGDGKAEIAMKTAPGTIDGQGNFVLMPGDDPYADYRNTSGYILSGPEYLTIFNGQTGAAMVTVPYIMARGDNIDAWGDTYGNRVDRFLATVAYLDGVRPSLVMCRGYYGPQSGHTMAKNVLAAWNWRDGVLTQLWTFEAAVGQDDNINSEYLGQGNHNLSVGDVDGDGKDEIIYGACAIDDDGTGLYSTGLGHGDAIHLGDLDPSRPGLEVFDIHETSGSTWYGSEFRDAATGELIWGVTPGNVGRGVADDIYAGNSGAEMWSSNTGGLLDSDGDYIGRAPSSTNFLIWWDSDHVRELLDGTGHTDTETGAYVYDNYHIDKYGLSGDSSLLMETDAFGANGTKQTPMLSGDILGDWREEVILRTVDSSFLRIYTTTIPATDRIFTLMHDLQYRESIAWQNVAYNQPPHTSFYLGDGMTGLPTPNIYIVGSDTTPPTAPTGLTATIVSSNQVDLTWSEVAGATGYLIKRADQSGGPYTSVGFVAIGASYSDTTVINGQTSYYVVTAVSRTGVSPDSAEAQVTIPLPSPWVAQDIGNVGIPGRTTYVEGNFTLKGSALASGTGDAFQLCRQDVSGDSSIIANVLSLDTSAGSGGVTFRKSTAADSAFASVTVNSDGNVYFSYRLTDGGAIQSANVTATAPQWLQLTRIGNNFTAYSSTDGINWTKIGLTRTITMPTGILAGLTTSSISSSSLGTVIFSDVSVLAIVTNAAPTVATAASASPLTVTGATTDLSVLGADDMGEGNLTYTWATTGTPPAAVTFSVNGNNTAKNTVATFTKIGTYDFEVTITDAGGLSVTSSVSVNVVLTSTTIALTPASPVMVNAGATKQFTAVAKDQFGVALSQQPTFTWTLISGAGTLSSSGLYTASTVAGSAVVQASGGDLIGTAVVTTLVGGSLFTDNLDIGSPSPAGSRTYSSGTYTVRGGGADIWSSSDQFHFYYKSVTGDVTIIARVNSVQNTNASAKAGVMIRETTAAGSRNVFMEVTPGNGVQFQRRTSTNGNTSSTSVPGITAPYWVKLVRVGNSFSGYCSLDGINWTQVGSTVNISSMSSVTYVGLAVTSHANGTLCTSVFDNVSITQANTAPTLAVAAGATPNPATGATANLSVLGSDNGGEANLTYTWVTTGTPPAPVNFSDNGSNSAKNTIATFTTAGTYNFQVNIIDVAGLSVTSNASVTVNQTFTSIIVSPSIASLKYGTSKQFTATGYDQFGASISVPSFSWTATAGTINSSTGYYTAPLVGTTATVTASSGGKSGTASVRVFSSSSIMGRYVFYNNSKYDGHTGYLNGDPAINLYDDNAIATDKQALLPSYTGSFVNYTSFSRGINGIMIDIKYVLNPTGLTAADFLFKVGNGSGWTTAPAPNNVSVRVGEGVDGSDRVVITWEDNAVQNQWLQVTVKANNNTGLTAADVFYFGNAIAESGNDPANAVVDAEDELASRTHRTGFSTAAITNYYDYNRDGKVNLTDDLIARDNPSGSTPLELIDTSGPLAGMDGLGPLSLGITPLSSGEGDIAAPQPTLAMAATESITLQPLLSPAEILPVPADCTPISAPLSNPVSHASGGSDNLRNAFAVKSVLAVDKLVGNQSLTIIPELVERLDAQPPRERSHRSVDVGTNIMEGLEDVSSRRNDATHTNLASGQHRWLHDAVFTRLVARRLATEDSTADDMAVATDIDTFLQDRPAGDAGKSFARAIDTVFAAEWHKKQQRKAT